jgi:hypothetical protein
MKAPLLKAVVAFVHTAISALVSNLRLCATNPLCRVEPMATAAGPRKRKLGRPPLAWVEPEGYRAGLIQHVENLRNFLEDESNIGKVVCATYAKRPDREMLNVKSVTSEVLKILAPFGAIEQPMWPAAYVPCGPDGRALYYMKEAEIAVLRELMAPLVPKLRERCASGKCLVMGLTAARVFGGFPELRAYVVAADETEPGHGPCCLPHPSEWYKLHGEEKLGPVYAKLASVLGPEFPDLEAFERQINAAYRRARVSVGVWYHQNWTDEKRDIFCAKLKDAWVGNDDRKEQLSKLCKARWAVRRGEFVGKLKTTLAQPEVRSRKSQSAKDMWKKPEQWEKRSKHFNNPDHQEARRIGKKNMSKEDRKKHADNVSKGRLQKNGKEVVPDKPAAFGVRLPVCLTPEQKAAVVALLERHHESVVPEPADNNTLWALSRHDNAVRAGNPVRALLRKEGIPRSETGERGFYWMAPVERHPLRREGVSSSSSSGAS